MKTIKKLLFILFVLHSLLISAQHINLPDYTQGVYECDTLLVFTSPINDISGKVLLKDGLNTSLLTGVKFYKHGSISSWYLLYQNRKRA